MRKKNKQNEHGFLVYFIFFRINQEPFAPFLCSMSAPSVPAASATGVLGAYGVGGRFNSSSRAHPAAAVVRGIPPRPSHSPAVGASVVVLLLWRPMAWKWYVLDTQATVPHVRQYVWYSTQTFGAIWRPLCPIGPCSARACRKHVSLPVLFHVAGQCAW